VKHFKSFIVQIFVRVAGRYDMAVRQRMASHFGSEQGFDPIQLGRVDRKLVVVGGFAQQWVICV
jgi:hypothetical protein